MSENGCHDNLAAVGDQKSLKNYMFYKIMNIGHIVMILFDMNIAIYYLSTHI